jgi:hypothetical protein
MTLAMAGGGVKGIAGLSLGMHKEVGLSLPGEVGLNPHNRPHNVVERHVAKVVAMGAKEVAILATEQLVMENWLVTT